MSERKIQPRRGAADPRRKQYAERFKLTPMTVRKLKRSFIDCLDGCADDCARRVLLGLGRPR